MKSSKSLTTANVAGLDLDLWHPCLLSSWCGVRDRIIWGKECGGRSSNLLLIHTPPLLRRKWRNCLDSRIYPVSVACLPFRHIWPRTADGSRGTSVSRDSNQHTLFDLERPLCSTGPIPYIDARWLLRIASRRPDQPYPNVTPTSETDPVAATLRAQRSRHSLA
ncbi:hypothetical protein VTI28DRAFT_722 [Corynascus sepedonium]